jgi:cytochrome P450
MNKKVLGIELIAAGIDTTSNSAQWILLYMTQHPEVQEQLAATLKQVMSDAQGPMTAAHIVEAKLYSFVDEILRIHPVLPAGSRLFPKVFILIID